MSVWMLSGLFTRAFCAECGVSVLNSGRENNKGQRSDSPQFIANSEAAPSPRHSPPPLEHFNVSHWKIPTGEMSECPALIVHFPLLIALLKCLLNWSWRCVELDTGGQWTTPARHLTSQILMKPSGNFAILLFSFMDALFSAFQFSSEKCRYFSRVASCCVVKSDVPRISRLMLVLVGWENIFTEFNLWWI